MSRYLSFLKKRECLPSYVPHLEAALMHEGSWVHTAAGRVAEAKSMKLILTAILTVFFVSCTAVPQTDISYVPGVGGKLPTVRIKAPKDVDIQGFELVRDGTGQSTLKIKSYRARMNPLIIEAQSARDVDLVNAIGTQVITGMSEGAKLFATGGASSLVGSSRPVGAARPIGSLTNAPIHPSP